MKERPPLVTLVSMLTIIAPRSQLPQKRRSLDHGMICRGRQGVSVERNLTGTERCTVGYVGNTFL